MKVYKFGGASIADGTRMRALLPIVCEEQLPLLLVVSALGKTTNALEAIVNSAYKGDMEKAQELASKLKQQHLDYAREVLDADNFLQAEDAFYNLFREFDKAIKFVDPKRYDYSYDQVVCFGELFSTTIFHWLLVQQGKDSMWVDIRKVVLTDETYRDAVPDWDYTKLEAQAIIGRELKKGKVVVTQGFIGATTTGNSVTLGREGSDYTAAILAAMLKMDSVTIWKDVDGFRNGDPKQFANTRRIAEISYEEVIELAFYGAQIIHPKTIKPLHNNNIPLYVKCFLDKDLPGSVIKANVDGSFYPPMMVLKENQVLVEVTTRDYSFITEDNLSKLYGIFHALKVKVALIQNAAISFVACVNYRENKINALKRELEKDYMVTFTHDASILTVRHHNEATVTALMAGRKILLKQETTKTVQVVML